LTQTLAQKPPPPTPKHTHSHLKKVKAFADLLLDVGIGGFDHLLNLASQITAHLRRADGSQRTQSQALDVLGLVSQVTAHDKTVFKRYSTVNIISSFENNKTINSALLQNNKWLYFFSPSGALLRFKQTCLSPTS
jgi:hypothetical protein